MCRSLVVLVVSAALLAAGLVLLAGRSAPPSLTIDRPERVVGQQETLEITAGAPGARFTTLTVSVEQNG